MTVKKLVNKSKVAFAGRVLKADTSTLVVNDVLTYEDDFAGLYVSNNAKGNLLIQPPYNPATLTQLLTKNNVLAQCVQAMEVNIDGTGYTIEQENPEESEDEQAPKEELPPVQPPVVQGKGPSVEAVTAANAEKVGPAKANAAASAAAASIAESGIGGGAPKGMMPTAKPKTGKIGVKDGKVFLQQEADPEKKRLEAFFNEPYPGTSFVSIRRDLRYDLEATGNAYMEVIRNLAGDLVFLRRIESTMVRLVKLDGPVLVEKEIDRNGELVKASMYVRERRFCQQLGTKMLYFKEYGSTRDLNRDTGEWAKEGETLDPSKKASELLHFTLERDTATQYGIPRWINQMPSVLGSRKAEEFNLEFFDNGGIPPAVVFIQGGALLGDVRDQLLGYFGGKATHRVAVCEIQSTSGTLDSAGSVSVKTERFGDTARGDSMFQNYDDSCEEHVRVGFRLPPIFLGKSEDYNFATAMTAYLVTEAQVFLPERTEFDEVINKTVMKDLKANGYKFVSKPVSLKNIEIQLKAIELLMDQVDGESLVEMVNNLTGMTMKYSQEKVDKAAEMEQAAAEAGAAANPFGAPAMPGADMKGVKPGVNPKPATGSPFPAKSNVVPLKKSEMTPEEVVVLVTKWTQAMGLDLNPLEAGETKESILKTVNELTPSQRSLFDNVLATKSFASLGYDPSGLAEIASCCADVMP